MNTVGNIFSGQVVGDTAKTLSDRFCMELFIGKKEKEVNTPYQQLELF